MPAQPEKEYSPNCYKLLWKANLGGAGCSLSQSSRRYRRACGSFGRREEKMQKFIFLVLTLLLMSVTSAVAQDVRYNFAKDVDF